MTTIINNRQYTEILEKFGLNESETALYLASLGLGESGMTEIAKKANLKRSSAYLVFKTLEKKGFMGSFKMKKGLRFVATSPKILLSKAENHLSELQNIIPQLNNLSEQAKNKPKITYYEGIEGYKIMMEDSLQKQNNLLRQIGSLSELHKIVGEEVDLKNYIPRRLKNKISLKAIYSKDVSENIKKRNHPKELREIKYIPEKFQTKTATLIYDNKVIITTSKEELMAVVIESEEIADAEKKKFDLIWDLLESNK